MFLMSKVKITCDLPETLAILIPRQFCTLATGVVYEFSTYSMCS